MTAVAELFVAFRDRFGFDVPPRLAELCRTDERHRLSLAMKVGIAAPAAPKPRPAPGALPCRHRSDDPIGREPCLPCETLGKQVLVDVFACSSPKVFEGRATLHREVKDSCLCLGCRERKDPPMDAVYFFRHSGPADEELRYSIRSLIRHAPWIRRVFILGERPLWYVESDRVVHVPWETVAPQFGFATPVRNGFLMFVAATAIPGLADEFLSLSDDFVLVRDLSLAEARVDRCLNGMAKPTKPHKYKRFAWATWEKLQALGIPPVNFDAHVPMRFTKRRVLDAYADLKPHLSEERFGGLTNKIAILSHAKKREGFKPVTIAEGKFRAGWWGAPPSRGQFDKAVAEPSVLFLNFDDKSYGPTIAGFLQERFPMAGSWERSLNGNLIATPKPALHVHVVKHSGWIIGRIADAICCERTTVSRSPDPAADVNLYVHYRAMREPVPGTLNVAWFTHLEEEGKKRREFFDVAERADWCLAMSEGTARHLPPEKTSVWAGAPDRDFVKPTIRLGVAVKPGPRKGLEKLDAIRSIEGVEIVETGGAMPLADLPAFFRSIDYLLVTSDLEGGPYSVLEAIASGKPVIAPDVGFCWDWPVIRYDGTTEGLASIVRKLRFPLDPWAAASRELEAILRGVLESREAVTA